MSTSFADDFVKYLLEKGDQVFFCSTNILDENIALLCASNGMKSTLNIISNFDEEILKQLGFFCKKKIDFFIF